MKMAGQMDAMHKQLNKMVSHVDAAVVKQEQQFGQMADDISGMMKHVNEKLSMINKRVTAVDKELQCVRKEAVLLPKKQDAMSSGVGCN